jgi:maltose alpha-D-glucosyltransferase/alpha-amylase
MTRIAVSLDLKPSGGRSRIHGDYHLGQVLVAHDDVYIIDFEGEPRRTIEERRAKMSPLRDVAGMLRSIDYAAAAALRQHGHLAPGQMELVMDRAQRWRRQTSEDFLHAYREAVAGSPTHPEDTQFEQALLDLFLIQKAAYEIMYELSNRPGWTDIPLAGLLDLLDDRKVSP